jgi:hypothetical protein
MDIRRRVLGVAGGPDRPDAFAFDNVVVRTDLNRAQVEECDGVAVGCPDRHGVAVRG